MDVFMLMVCTATQSVAPRSDQCQGFDTTFFGTGRHEIQADRDRSWHSGGCITSSSRFTAISLWTNNEASLLFVISFFVIAFVKCMAEISFDKKDHFKNPVSKTEVPDYFDIVENPMCWTMIEAKINKFEYWDFQAFRVRPYVSVPWHVRAYMAIARCWTCYR